jgi:hypothetical protein
MALPFATRAISSSPQKTRPTRRVFLSLQGKAARPAAEGGTGRYQVAIYLRPPWISQSSTKAISSVSIVQTTSFPLAPAEPVSQGKGGVKTETPLSQIATGRASTAEALIGPNFTLPRDKIFSDVKLATKTALKGGQLPSS